MDYTEYPNEMFEETVEISDLFHMGYLERTGLLREKLPLPISSRNYIAKYFNSPTMLVIEPSTDLRSIISLTKKDARLLFVPEIIYNHVVAALTNIGAKTPYEIVAAVMAQARTSIFANTKKAANLGLIYKQFAFIHYYNLVRVDKLRQEMIYTEPKNFTSRILDGIAKKVEPMIERQVTKILGQ